jgi:K+-transporting ATPase ATPase C chain
MNNLIRPALTLFLLLSIMTGIAYPVTMTLVAQWLFPEQANGSLIVVDGKTVGSALIGQNFTDPGHFWGRPSATSPQPYNGIASGGSNLGPLNPGLTDAVKGRLETLKAADSDTTHAVPTDLATASASGLDPEISVAAARYQIPRIARARHLSEAQLGTLIANHIQSRQWGILGEERVNVLKLNLALDRLH